MRKLTRTLLGTLLLAGSATAALAVGPSEDTLSGQNSPPSSTAPAQLSQAQAPAQPSANQPGMNQPAQNQPGQNQPAQNRPKTTEGMWSQDLAAGAGQPATGGSGQARPQGAASARQSANADQSTVPDQSASVPRTGGAHRHAARHVAKGDPSGDRMTEALNILGSDGYTNVESLTPQGEQFIANAMQNGR